MNEFSHIIPVPPQIGGGDPVRHPGWLGWLLASNRGVLGVALTLAILIPELLHARLSGLGPWFAIHPAPFEPSRTASAVAIVVAHLSLRRVGLLPMIEAKSLILPSFAAAYGLAIATLYVTREDFGRFHLWTSFLIAVPWYFLVSILRGRLLRPRLGLVGDFGDAASRFGSHVDWVSVPEPRLEGPISAVVVDRHASLDADWSHFITGLVLRGTPVYHRVHLEEGMLGRVRFESAADNNFGALLPSLTYLRLKRLVDVTLAAVVLPLAGPLMLLAALAVRCDSRGPALFRQVRMGYRGRPFTCLKLRSMHVGSGGSAFTLEGDARVTRVGRVIRKWRIDELPQIFNILVGDMSWIGPRPEALDLALHYERHVPFYAYRHAVRPGISGWAAVHQGNVGDVDAAREKLEYDFYYIKHFSVWLDVLIALKTVQTVASGFGSR